MTTASKPSSALSLDSLCADYLTTQLGGDRRAALRLIDDGLAGGATVEDIRAQVIQAAQREIGRLWQEDRISVAQEHMATAISQLALAHLFQHVPLRPRVERKILIACVSGEQHEFPARLLADSLDAAGYDVRFLGADVPLDALLDAIEAERPDIVALSATMMFNLPSLREAVRAVRARSAVPIAVGGHALADSTAADGGTGADLVARDGTTFVHGLDVFLGASA